MKRYVFLIIAAVVVMFAMMTAAQIIMLRSGSQAEQLDKVMHDLEESQRIAEVKIQVERAVWTTQQKVEKNLSNPDGFYVIANQLVRICPNILGAGVAFRPGYFSKKGKQGLYAPYAYDEEPSVTLKKQKSSAPNIRTRLLPFNYVEREWFSSPITDGKSHWSQPYMDLAGTRIIMCTFSNAVRDEQGQIVAVIFADVPMEDVSVMTDDTTSGTSHDILLLLGMMSVCLIVLCLIVWRAVVASVNYSKTKIDSDRQQLIDEIDRLKAVNRRLTERNVELSRKIPH